MAAFFKKFNVSSVVASGLNDKPGILASCAMSTFNLFILEGDALLPGVMAEAIVLARVS